MSRYFIARLFDGERQIAAEEVFTEFPGRAALEACEMFASDDHGAIEVDGLRLDVFGPYTLDEAKPTGRYKLKCDDDAPMGFSPYSIAAEFERPAVDLADVLAVIRDWPAGENSDPDAMARALSAAQTLAARVLRGERVDLDLIKARLEAAAELDADDPEEGHERDLLMMEVDSLIAGLG